MALADEYLARQHVVADVEVVVCVLAVIDESCAAGQLLETRQPGLRRAERAFDEETLGNVISQSRPVNEIGAEILDAHHADEAADLEVFPVDGRLLYLATLDLGFDDLPRLLGTGRSRLLVPDAEQVLRRSAARHREQSADQKKNANPTFHSSTSSLSSRLVKTT